MLRHPLQIASLVLLLLSSACRDQLPGGPRQDGSLFDPDKDGSVVGRLDAGSRDAADSGRDASWTDTGWSDSGWSDTGWSDTGSVDLGVDGGRFDAGDSDGGLVDGGSDGGAIDAGNPSDSGTFDSGLVDSGLGDGGFDSGIVDSGPTDTGVVPDAGFPGTGDVWVEIDYRNAYSPQSPRWSFSNTPGWGEPQWAVQGESWPEAWDRFNNMTVGSDPIGNSLLFGSSGELQLMIGLEEMISYQYATVELEGRSRSTCCSATFEVFNPLTGCGVGQVTMSNDWNPDIVLVDIGQCLLTGSGGHIEAVRVAPTNGTLALLRMRVTLHGARW